MPPPVHVGQGGSRAQNTETKGQDTATEGFRGRGFGVRLVWASGHR